MDSYREHPGDFDLPSAAVEAAADQGVSEIGTDERRMQVRAYNYWVSLLRGRDYPSIEDLEPGDVSDFARNSVLLDFTAGRENPALPYIGASIREECGLAEGVKTIGEVPSRSLLSRLTDHYLQIIANRAPIGFEAEFVNQRGEAICYRGILMPFSSDGDTIDFIYGVLNWKQSGAPADELLVPAPEAEIAPQLESGSEAELADAPADEEWQAPAVEFDACTLAEQGEEEEPLVLGEEFALPVAGDTHDIALAPPVHFSWEDGPLADPETGELPEIRLDAEAGLADRLWAARETADALKDADCRSRTALYRALSMAYDFALASLAEPDDYAELLEESGVKAQARAPMTPIVKLVFGIDYDKARLTEFAAALSYGQRQQVEAGGFLKFIEGQAGGLKALVAAERQARRPEPKPDLRGEAARDQLRRASPIALDTVDCEAEFALVLARRSVSGGLEPVAVVEDQAMVDRAIRRAAS